MKSRVFPEGRAWKTFALGALCAGLAIASFEFREATAQTKGPQIYQISAGANDSAWVANSSDGTVTVCKMVAVDPAPRYECSSAGTAK